MKVRLTLFLIISLAVLANADSVTESCIESSCKQEMTDCLSTQECKSQINEMAQCYANTEDCYASEGLFDIEQSLKQTCMENCLNSASLQTLEGSNLIRCQLESCLEFASVDLAGSSQNKAYVIFWAWFFGAIILVALAFKFLMKLLK